MGEQIKIGGVLRFHGLPFLCVQNGGGRTYTSEWL